MTRKAIKDEDIRWDLIEADYRADKKSISQIAREHGITRNRLKRRAERDGWERDLSDRISQAAKHKLNKAIADAAADKLPETATKAERDQQIIEVVAQTQVELVRSHRGDIASMRRIACTMMGKLEEAILEGLKISMADDPNAQPVIMGMELETAGKIFNNLTGSYQRLVVMERQAFGMDEKGGNDGASKEMQTAFEMILGRREGLPGEVA